MLFVALLAGCEPYDARAHFADCTSETIDSAGVRVATTYDQRGWPILEETVAPEGEPVIAETEYSVVAGRVVESLTVIDGGEASFSILYDGHEHLRSFSTNGADPEADYECSLEHGKADRLVKSDCSNGVLTTYDDCQNPDKVETDTVEESWGFTYRDCQILAGQILGADEVGPYAVNFQYVLGREVSRVTERDGVLTSTFTTWDCPEPVE